jgi:two-component system, chemotaxis family, CheB/CheR fusion protein
MNSKTVVFEQDRELRYAKLYNPNPDFSVEGVLGRGDEDIYPLKDATHLIKIKQAALESRTIVREEVQTTIDGEVFYQDLIIHPIVDENGEISGILCSSMNITERKRMEIKATLAQEYATAIVATVREPLVVLDADLRIVSVSRFFCQKFQVTSEETEGNIIYDLGNRQWDIPQLRELLERILPENTVFDDFKMTHEFENIGKRTMLLNARQVVETTGKGSLILLAIEDITDR